MPIKLNAIEIGQPGIAGGGEKKYYARANTDGEVTLEGLSKTIARMSTVSGTDVLAVLHALVEVMTDGLADSKNMRLGDLGSLRVSISSEPRDKKEDINGSVVRGSRVIFTPGKKIRNMLKTLEFVKNN